MASEGTVSARWVEGCSRPVLYHSLMELTIPKISLVASPGSISPLTSPTRAAFATSSAT